MTTWFYLSFASASLPKNEQWLGAVIVQADTIADAVKEAWRLGINPGGEVAGAEIENLPPERFRNRLMISKSDLRDMGEAMAGDTRLINLRGEIVKPDGVEDDPYTAATGAKQQEDI
jgi:hypothetical protein